MKLLVTMIQGFCMALADSVPGVSGGTIAFILGFYDKFIFSLDALIRGSRSEKKEAIRFLGKLAAGWVIGFGCSMLVLGAVFETHIYQLSSLFMGMTLFAIPIVAREERKNIGSKYHYLIFTGIGVGVVSLITYLHQVISNNNTYNVGSLSLFTVVYVFTAAMIAISAMVLPGISGSTLLLVFGLYMPIINAIKEFLHFNFSYFPILLVFGLGIITGIITTIRLVKMGMEKCRCQMIYLILGLMSGSLYAIAMGPTTLDNPQPALTLQSFHILYFVLGGAIVAGLTLIKGKMADDKERSK